ncbi:hypothetical protein F4780DRAFT_729461 [Xylariomycetidae sp. FL0641]|nr:hypothetical protein F4780DRAFT_729461 [Xylariomycetidae sp. FL0641]
MTMLLRRSLDIRWLDLLPKVWISACGIAWGSPVCEGFKTDPSCSMLPSVALRTLVSVSLGRLKVLDVSNMPFAPIHSQALGALEIGLVDESIPIVELILKGCCGGRRSQLSIRIRHLT